MADVRLPPAPPPAAGSTGSARSNGTQANDSVGPVASVPPVAPVGQTNRARRSTPAQALGQVVPSNLAAAFAGAELSWQPSRGKLVMSFRPGVATAPGVVGAELAKDLGELESQPEAVAHQVTDFFLAFERSNSRAALESLRTMTAETFHGLSPKVRFALGERIALKRAQEGNSSPWGALAKTLGLAAARSLVPIDVDTTFPINLLSYPRLANATAKLARELGGKFVDLAAGVEAAYYLGTEDVKTIDLERTAKLVLTTRDGRIVSQDKTLAPPTVNAGYRTDQRPPPSTDADPKWHMAEQRQFFTMTLDGKPVFEGADGELLMQQLPGMPPTLVPPERIDEARASREDVRVTDVTPRRRRPEDAPARPNMQYAWRGDRHKTIDTSFWGSCESAAALHAMGLTAAKANVMLIDRAQGKATAAPANDISMLMTHLARVNVATFDVNARAVGQKNGSGEFDDDPPEPFHQLMLEAAKTGSTLAADLEPGVGVWNYGVSRVMLSTPKPAVQHGDGTVTEHWQAVLVSDENVVKEFEYSRRVDERGRPVEGGTWSSHFRPDTMRSFVLGKTTTLELGMPSTVLELDARWSQETAATTLALYATSQSGAKGDTVYAVKEADGTVRKMTSAQWHSLRESMGLAAPELSTEPSPTQSQPGQVEPVETQSGSETDPQ